MCSSRRLRTRPWRILSQYLYGLSYPGWFTTWSAGFSSKIFTGCFLRSIVILRQNTSRGTDFNSCIFPSFPLFEYQLEPAITWFCWDAYLVLNALGIPITRTSMHTDMQVLEAFAAHRSLWSSMAATKVKPTPLWTVSQHWMIPQLYVKECAQMAECVIKSL